MRWRCCPRLLFALILDVRVAGFLQEQPGRGQIAPVVNGGTVSWTVAILALILVPIALILGVRVASFFEDEPGHGQGYIGGDGERSRRFSGRATAV